MPLRSFIVTVSNENVYVAPDRETAVSLALQGQPGNKATPIEDPHPSWPRLKTYDNDTTSFYQSVVPKYIWDSTTSGGQSRGFAVSLTRHVLDSVHRVLIDLMVFADNAHVAVVEIYNIEGDSASLVETLNFPILTDGNTDPVTGFTEAPPYNWQAVRKYTVESDILLAANTEYEVILSFRAVNYNSPPGRLNPAGLAFYAGRFVIS